MNVLTEHKKMYEILWKQELLNFHSRFLTANLDYLTHFKKVSLKRAI